MEGFQKLFTDLDLSFDGVSFSEHSISSNSFLSDLCIPLSICLGSIRSPQLKPMVFAFLCGQKSMGGGFLNGCIRRDSSGLLWLPLTFLFCLLSLSHLSIQQLLSLVLSSLLDSPSSRKSQSGPHPQLKWRSIPTCFDLTSALFGSLTLTEEAHVINLKL